MTGDVVGMKERRSSIAAACENLADLAAAVHQVDGEELADLMSQVDSLAAMACAARVVVAAEAVARGQVASEGTNAQSWVRDHAPSLRQGGAGHVAELAVLASSGGPLWRTGSAVVQCASPKGMVLDGVVNARVSPSLAVATLREIDRLDPVLADEAKPTVAEQLLELGVAWGPATMRGLRPRLVATYGRTGAFDRLQERLVGLARLSMPMVQSGDLTEYLLAMTPEQAVALEAAIGPLSAPAPSDETGERDHRCAGQRRVEALAEVCRRSSSIDASASGADGAAGASSAVHVVMSLQDLEARTGFGEVLGSTATGVVLSPETLRRLCCEADLVPHVLGAAGEELDLGRVVRLFSRAQRRSLRRRDRGCTYPGCTAPAAWTRAHHVRHWADGGPTDLDNAALLCQRHHTVVHQRRLVARVRRRPDEQGRFVVWDLTPGSYDRHLQRLTAERSASDPPELTPARLADLVHLISHGAEVERRIAQYELACASEDPPDDEGMSPAEIWADWPPHPVGLSA